MKKIVSVFAFLGVLCAFGIAYAQGALPGPDSDIGGFFVFLYEKLRSAEWMMAFGGALVLLVWVVRKFLSSHFAWFKTKLGGYVTSLGTALGLALGTALMAGQALSMGLAMTALSASFMAAGGWEALRDLLAFLVGSKSEE